MSEDMNEVFLIGRLTRDAELSYLNSGTAKSDISIAVNKRKKQGEEWVDVTSFFDLTVWAKRAESLNPYLLKGQQIAVVGSLRQDRWEDKEGQKRSKIRIDVEKIQLIGSKTEGSQTTNNTQANGQQQNYQQQPGYHYGYGNPNQQNQQNMGQLQGFNQNPGFQQNQGNQQNQGFQQAPAGNPNQPFQPFNPNQQGNTPQQQNIPNQGNPSGYQTPPPQQPIQQNNIDLDQDIPF